MSKELETFSKEKQALDWLYDISCNIQDTTPEYNILKTALQRLEAIDNANPSEALERLEQFLNEMTYCLEHPKEYAKGYEKQIFWKYKNTFETTIKQALLKAQEQEKEVKALEIIKEKKVNILLLELTENVDEYNERIVPNGKLTEEEFDLLKEVLE